MRVGFTGSQVGMNIGQWIVLRFLLEKLHPTEAHHGDCIGSDVGFHNIVTFSETKVVIHPPENQSKRAFLKGDRQTFAKPYLVRNKDIVNSSDLLIATPKEKTEQLRSGTWSTIRYARKVGKPCIIILP